MKTPRKLLLAALSTLPACHAAPTPAGADRLGRIDFPNSGPRAAQEPFLRGVLLLHSFEYDDAAEAFRAAERIAPDFALAYWGEALTHYHPIWRQEDRAAAQDALVRLAPTAAERATKTNDPRERGLLAAVEALFGTGTAHERALAYCDAMDRLHARYPKDLEVAAFDAVAILGTSTQGRDEAIYMRAAAVAEEVLERAPDHPGALHYAIHSFDDPVHAPLGLRMARRYGKVAPDAEHALHMPSHIYVALGMWPESVAANIDSAAAADERRAKKKLGVDERGYHSLSWLLYSQLQLGDTGAAEKLLRDMIRDEAESRSTRARGHLVVMRAAWAVATQRFDDEFAQLTVDPAGLGAATTAAEYYVRGRHALARGDAAAAAAALHGIEAARGSLDDLPASAQPASQCAAPAPAAGYLPGRLAARVTELELSGLIRIAAHQDDEGVKELRQAAEREDASGFDFGPPVIVEPAHELLGYVLLERGKADEAAREFGASLKRAPGRARSVAGRERARGGAAPAAVAGSR